MTINSLWLVLLGSFCSLCVVAQDYAITDYIISGTGCVPGSVSAAISSDSQNIAVTYNNFVAYAGPSYDYDDNRKNCQLTLSVSIPSGYQFAFDRFSHNGVISIEAGVEASYATTYYFQSSVEESSGFGNFTGPTKADVALGGSFSPLIWSPCGKSSLVGINTALRLDNSAASNSSGSFTLLSTPTNSFIWKTC